MEQSTETSSELSKLIPNMNGPSWQCVFEYLYKNGVTQINQFQLFKLHDEIETTANTLSKKIWLFRDETFDCDSTKIIIKEKDIPDDIKYLVNITEVVIPSNKWKTVPKAISNMTQLTRLCISSCNISKLPSWIFQLINLETLELSNNKLTIFPYEISYLRKLKRLSVISCQLKSLPKCIGKLTNLELLALCGNKLTTLPDEIKYLHKLTALWVSHNQLTSFPDSIYHLTELDSLDVSHNKIPFIPVWIIKLTKLKSFSITHNQLTFLPNQIYDMTHIENFNIFMNPFDDPMLFQFSREPHDNTSIRMLQDEIHYAVFGEYKSLADKDEETHTN